MSHRHRPGPRRARAEPPRLRTRWRLPQWGAGVAPGRRNRPNRSWCPAGRTGRDRTGPALAGGHDIAVRADSCIDSSWSPVRVNAPASGRRLAWTNDTSWPPRGVRQSPRTVPGRRGRRPASSGERSVCPRPKVWVTASTPARWRWIWTVSATGCRPASTPSRRVWRGARACGRAQLPSTGDQAPSPRTERAGGALRPHRSPGAVAQLHPACWPGWTSVGIGRSHNCP